MAKKKIYEDEIEIDPPLKEHELKYITNLMLSPNINKKEILLYKYWKCVNLDKNGNIKSIVDWGKNSGSEYIFNFESLEPLGKEGRRFTNKSIPHEQAQRWYEQWSLWIPYQKQYEHFKPSEEKINNILNKKQNHE